MGNRMLDAKIAVEKYGWTWEEKGFGVEGQFLVPPPNDERIHWCATWDKDGIPSYLPEFHKHIMDSEVGMEAIEYRWERGYDLTSEKEATQMLDDFEWLMRRVKELS